MACQGVGAGRPLACWAFCEGVDTSDAVRGITASLWVEGVWGGWGWVRVRVRVGVGMDLGGKWFEG